MADEQGKSTWIAAQKSGCFTTMVGTALGAIIVGALSLIFLSPWALHMGGRPTPFLRWHGVGKLASPDGANYALYLDLSVSKLGADTSRVSNLNGSAKLCGPRLGTVSYHLMGTVYKAWVSAEDKRMVLHLYSPKDGQKLDFDLEGSWQGQQLILNDRGSMTSRFNADGSPRVGRGVLPPRKISTVVLEYGSQSSFDSLCQAAK
jgi:hypothetical protein